jgi:dephospho-CoA kinase
MRTIGITGGIGSGKTAVTDYLATKGITIVDADLASRVIVEPGRPALETIFEHFGQHLKLSDGSLDRAGLRTIVFNDTEARLWLEQLTHPLIGEEIQQQLAAAEGPYRVLSSPLLLEGTQVNMTDYVVVVDVPEEVQIARASARDNNDPAQIKRIMAAQLTREERKAKSDYVVDNSGSLDDLHIAAEQLHQHLLGLD